MQACCGCIHFKRKVMRVSTGCGKRIQLNWLSRLAADLCSAHTTSPETHLGMGCCCPCPWLTHVTMMGSEQSRGDWGDKHMEKPQGRRPSAWGAGVSGDLPPREQVWSSGLSVAISDISGSHAVPGLKESMNFVTESSIEALRHRVVG